MRQRLLDRVAVVTGGARGIGKAVALGFAREGADVVIADTRSELAQETAREVASTGRRAVAVEVDVSRPAEIDRMVARSLSEFGRIDILHNNAGVYGGHGDLFAYTPEEWDRIIDVNLKGAFFVAQKVARAMVERGTRGKILNTASTSAFIASGKAIVPYDVSKAGVRQLTVSLASHLVEYGINVNAIAPGTIDTELSRGTIDPEERAVWLAQHAREKIPMQRPGQPEDLVGAAVFLCSDEADYVTGHVLVVDGGLLIR